MFEIKIQGIRTMKVFYAYPHVIHYNQNQYPFMK